MRKANREEDEGDIDVERHHVREYGDRGDRGHDDLGQVLSEECLEALDAFHQREYHVAGPVTIEVTRTEFQRVFIDLMAQLDLDDVRRVVTDRVLPVLEQTARYDQRRNGRQRQRESREARLSGEDPVNHDTRDGQPGDTGAHCDKAQYGSEQYPEPDTASQSEQTPVEIPSFNPRIGPQAMRLPTS